jgi:hypothetical protein
MARMRSRRAWLPAVLILLLPLLFLPHVATLTGLSPAAMAEGALITPSSGPAGTAITLSDSPGDMPHGASLTVSFDGVYLASGTAGDMGQFSIVTQVPLGAVPDVHTLMVYCNARQMLYSFTVTGPAAVSPTATEAPAATSTWTPLPNTSTMVPSSTATALPFAPTATDSATADASAASVVLSVDPASGPPGALVHIVAPRLSFPGPGTAFFSLTDAAGNVNNLALPVNSDGSVATAVALPPHLVYGPTTLETIARTTASVAGWMYQVQPVLTSAPGALGTVVVHGEGFSPDSLIAFRVDAQPLSLSGIGSDGSGHFEATLPPLVAGNHLLSAVAQAGGVAGNLALIDTTPTAPASRTVTPSHTPSSSATPTATRTPTGTRTPTAMRTPSSTRTPSPGAAARTGEGTAVTFGSQAATAPPAASVHQGTTAYFAEGYTGSARVNHRATFTELVNVLNPAPSPAVLTFAYYLSGRTTPILVRREVSAFSAARESVNQDVGPEKEVAMIITSPQQVVVTRSLLRQGARGDRLDGSTSGPVNAPSIVWYFAEGYTGASFQEYLTLFNPSGRAARTAVLLPPAAGGGNGSRWFERVVGPDARVTIDVRSANAGNAARSVGMVVTSDVPIVAERVEYFGAGSGSGKFGSLVTPGAVSLSRQAIILHGSSGGLSGKPPASRQAMGDQMFVTILNPLSASLRVSARLTDAAGRQVRPPIMVTVAGGTRQTLALNAALGAAAMPGFCLSLSGSAPFAAEAAQYYGGSPNEGRHPGSIFTGLAVPLRRAAVTDLSPSLGGARSRRSLFVSNPASRWTLFTLSYFGTGVGRRESYRLAPGATKRIDLPVAAGDEALGAVLTTATGSDPVYLEALSRTTDGASATEEVGAAWLGP